MTDVGKVFFLMAQCGPSMLLRKRSGWLGMVSIVRCQRRCHRAERGRRLHVLGSGATALNGTEIEVCAGGLQGGRHHTNSRGLRRKRGNPLELFIPGIHAIAAQVNAGRGGKSSFPGSVGAKMPLLSF